MTKNTSIKLISATVAALAITTAPALAQDPLSQGYGGNSDNINAVCAEGTEPVGGNVGGLTDTPSGVAPSGGSGECADVLGDSAGGGDDPATTQVNDPGGVIDDQGDPSDSGEVAAATAGGNPSDPGDPGEGATATAGDPGDPPVAGPAAARAVDSLPFTGADITLLAAMGVALFLLGLGLSHLTHHRRAPSSL